MAGAHGSRNALQRTATTPRWDLAVIVLLGVFFVWVGGTAGWLGLGLVRGDGG